MGHHPGHACPSQGPTTSARLAWSAGIFALSAVLQAWGGFWTGSLGLVSDSLENLNDVLVNLMALTGLAIANRREPSDRYAYGWHRLEVFNTLAGGLMLLGLAAAVVYEAVLRFRHPHPIQTGWVLVFSSLGLLLNLMATLVLRPSAGTRQERDSSLRTAYLHAFTDALTSVGLVASMLLIRATGWAWVDPAIALVIVLVILRGAVSLLADAAGILMHRAAFDHDAARADLMKLPGVKGVEDLRSWKVCSHLTICTAHVVVEAERLQETEPFLEDIEQVLGEGYGVRHLTLHFETGAMAARHHHRFIHRHEATGAEHPEHPDDLPHGH
ncbi:MAG: cation transporter [Holophagaceae bacterium]|nr:cation transporter [Holophagaceae bacterium]